MYKKYVEELGGLTTGNQEMDKEELLAPVKHCWQTVEEQCKAFQYSAPNTLPGSTRTQGWKIVRLFVSSTFSDFFNEREVLVKKVFPELREWCEERCLRLVECDLRWGVPRDTATPDTILTCLEEIDRCNAETDGDGFFMLMVGERYGWKPPGSDVTEELMTRYNWIPDTSITFMEVMIGAFKQKNQNALIFTRNSDFLKYVPQCHLSLFQDTDILDRQHQTVLKQKLSERFPTQIFPYTCQFDGISNFMGQDMVKLKDFDFFAQKTLDFFKEAINRKYHNCKNVKQMDESEQEDELQTMYLATKSQVLIGRDVKLKIVMNLIKGDTPLGMDVSGKDKGFVRKPDFWQCGQWTSNVVCVLAPPGSGKSSLLATIINEAMKEDGLRVFYHFAGSTSTSADPRSVLQRLLDFFTVEVDKKELSQKTVTEMATELKAALTKTQKTDTRILLVLDALNEMSDRETYDHLTWLPPLFPSNVCCLVSTADDHLPTVARILEHPTYKVRLGMLTKDSAVKIVENHLGLYNKKLDAEQVSFLTAEQCAGNPFWLWLICEELRVFGHFRTLTDRIKTVSVSVDSLLTAILSRLVEEDNTGSMEKALGLIGCSDGCLTVTDITKLLGDVEKKLPAPLITWARIRLHLKPYLRIVGYLEHVSFVHSTVLKAVGKNIVNDPCKYRACHSQLADFYEFWCEDPHRRAQKLPRHLQQAGLTGRLIDFVKRHSDARLIPDLVRRSYLNKCRCQKMADPKMAANVSVLICAFCANSRSLPSGFHQNKDQCVICCSFMFPGNIHGSVVARYCMCHSHGQTLMASCSVCNKMTGRNHPMVVEGRMCGNCGFGFGAKQCVKLVE